MSKLLDRTLVGFQFVAFNLLYLDFFNEETLRTLSFISYSILKYMDAYSSATNWLKSLRLHKYSQKFEGYSFQMVSLSFVCLWPGTHGLETLF